MEEKERQPLDISSVVTEMRKEQDGIKEEEKKIVNPFSFLNIKKATADKIQEEADTSKIAIIGNRLIFEMTPCKNRQLTEEEVQRINPAGGIVASIMVLAPNLPLSHPFIILAIRIATLYIKVRTVCNTIVEGVEKAKSVLGGIKPEHERMVVHK